MRALVLALVLVPTTAAAAEVYDHDAFAMTARDGWVFFSTMADEDQLFAVAPHGVVEVVTTIDGDRIISLTADDDYVYYASRDGAVGRIARVGGATTTLGHDLGWLGDVAVDDTTLYVATLGTFDGPDYTHKGSLLAFPKAGGDPTTLAGELGVCGALALDAGHVYVAVEDPATEVSALWAYPKAGGDGVRLAKGRHGMDMQTLVLFGDSLYYADGDAVWRVATDGASRPARVARAKHSEVMDLAVTDEAVYFSAYADWNEDAGDEQIVWRLWRAADGAKPKVLATATARDEAHFGPLTATGNALFWSDGRRLRRE